MKATDWKEGLVFDAGATSREREKGNGMNEYRSAPEGVLHILREDRSRVSCTAESRFSVENAPKPKFMS